MILVGLTGGIASGKSTVSRFFQEQGATIVDADQICHRLIRKEGGAYNAVKTTFGKTIIDADGEINRGKLGHIVFRDVQKREVLNNILHPMVFKALKKSQDRLAREKPQGVLVFDAPLLIESEAHEWMDWVILVYVDATTQKEHLVKRGELTLDEASLRIAAQMSLDEKRPFADEIIDNRKPLHEVQSEVCAIYQKLLIQSATPRRKTRT